MADSRVAGVIGVLFLLSSGSGAQAQETAIDQAARARYDATFAAMMADLSDPEKSFEFVQAAIDTGDLRGAISALERVLLLRPDLANVKMELGILYRRAGAPETAEIYLSEARASGEVPPDLEERLERELAQAQAERSPHRLDGSIFLGARYETNANAGPESRRVNTAVGPIELIDEDVEQSDVSGVAVLDLEHRYDLGYQSGSELFSEFVAYNSRYSDVTESNVALLDLTTGPRFYRGDPATPIAIRPFVTSSLLWLGKSFYRSQAGAGVTVGQNLFPSLSWETTLSGVYQNFNSSGTNPGASDQTGPFWLASGRASLPLAEQTYLQLGAHGFARSAREDFESFREVGGETGLLHYFDPGFFDSGPWSANASIGFDYSWYDEPDPQIDPDDEQRDQRLTARFSLNVPFATQWSAIGEVSYTRNDSNYDTEEFDNLALLLGVHYRFSLLP